VLALPDFSGKYAFTVETDASDIAIGAVLSQKDAHGISRVIQYASKALTNDERKWHTQEKEAFAIVWALDHFRPYLVGDPFEVHTDHASLKFLEKAEKGRLARWALNLAEFDFLIKYKKGSNNANADAMSRNLLHSVNTGFDPENPERAMLMNKSFIPIQVNSLKEIQYDYVYNVGDQSTSIIAWVDSIKAEQNTNAEFVELKKLILKEITLQEFRSRFPHSRYIRLMKRQALFQVVEGTVAMVVNQDTVFLIPCAATALKKKLLQIAHSHCLSGHVGVFKTYRKLQSRYFWPKMKQDVKKYIRACVPCAKFKTPTPTKIKNPLNPSLVSSFNQRVGIDMVGPITKCVGTKNHMITTSLCTSMNSN
jgi:hypothetical protein